MKMIAGIVTALLTTTLLAFGVTPANAHHGYPPDIRTYCSAWAVDNPTNTARRPRIRVRVDSDYQGRTPNSDLVIRVRDRRTNRVVVKVTRFYDGGRATYRLPRLKRGRYTVIVRADVRAHRYKNCNARHGLRVRRA